MITGELKSKIDAVWNDFWSGGISNPLEVMEQLTLLLFIKGLDETQTRAERKANRTGQPIEDVIFPEGTFTPEGKTTGRPYADLRWDRLKNLPAKEMFDVVEKFVFPFLQERTAASTHGKHMKGARFTIPTPALLQKAVDGLDSIPMEDRDTKGDVYEYMLAKVANPSPRPASRPAASGCSSAHLSDSTERQRKRRSPSFSTTSATARTRSGSST